LPATLRIGKIHQDILFLWEITTICQISKKQSIVATSTVEAEYISTSIYIKKILWIKNILYEIFIYIRPITIFSIPQVLNS